MLLGTVQAVSFSADPAHGRFPPPWTVEEQSACFVVRDHSGQALAYVYFEDEPGRRSAGNPIGPKRHSKEKKMQKWEYNLLVQSPNTECARCEEALNGLGRDGWELVTFYVNGAGDNVFVLKKPKEQ
jgi:hypothetical protein